MRDIIFRGKRADNGEWVYGDLRQYRDIPIKCDDFYCIDTNSTVEGFGTNHTVIGRTIGQYTGLTDKNGVKIFEGDIVTANKKPLFVCFNKFSWEMLSGDVQHHHRLEKEDSNKFEVIGNIHENFELLDKIDED